METSEVSLVILPVGVGTGAVVLSKGRVVGGISVTLPVGSDSVMFAVSVTTRVDGVSETSGADVVGGTTMVEFTIGISTVVVPTGRVRVDVVLTAMELDLVIPPVRSSVFTVPLKVEEDTLREVEGVKELGAVVTGMVRMRVVLIVGVSTTMDELVEGEMTPLDAAELNLLEVRL